MRPQDRLVFRECAAHLKLWILVRRTNPDSLAYVGLPNYTPKPLDCKAKTADKDAGGKTLKGLVVDPRIHADAFHPGKQQKAVEAWKSTEPLIGHGRFTVETNQSHRHYGCLKLGPAYLHGDYDLYDIVDPAQPHRNLASVEEMHGQAHRRGPNFYRVQEFVNPRIGSPMVQHGGEAQYTDHSEQEIDVFSPQGEEMIIPNRASAKFWYARVLAFKTADGRLIGRPTLGH